MTKAVAIHPSTTTLASPRQRSEGVSYARRLVREIELASKSVPIGLSLFDLFAVLREREPWRPAAGSWLEVSRHMNRNIPSMIKHQLL